MILFCFSLCALRRSTAWLFSICLKNVKERGDQRGKETLLSLLLSDGFINWASNQSQRRHLCQDSLRAQYFCSPTPCVRYTSLIVLEISPSTRTHTHMHTHPHARTCAHTHTHMHARTHTCTRIHMHARTCAHTHTHRHARTHTHRPSTMCVWRLCCGLCLTEREWKQCDNRPWGKCRHGDEQIGFCET